MSNLFLTIFTKFALSLSFFASVTQGQATDSNSVARINLENSFSECFSSNLFSQQEAQKISDCINNANIESDAALDATWQSNWPTTFRPAINTSLCSLIPCIDNVGNSACQDIVKIIKPSCTPYLEQNWWGFVVVPLFIIGVVISATVFRNTTYGALLRKNYLLRKHLLLKSTLLQLTSLLLIILLVIAINAITGTMDSSYVFSAGQNVIFTNSNIAWTVYYTEPDDARGQIFTNLSPFMGLIYLIVLSYPIANIIIALVNERETRMKEMLRISGMNDFTAVMAWFATFGLKLMPLTLANALLSYFGELFTNRTVSELWFFFWSFGMMYVGFSMFLMAFLNSGTRIAALGSVMFAFLLFFFTFAPGLSSDDTNYLGMCFVPSFCLSFGVKYLTTSSAAFVGIDANVIGSIPEPWELGLIMLVWAAVYAILGWYFEYVIPQKFGQQRHFLFPLKLLWNFCKSLPKKFRRTPEAIKKMQKFRPGGFSKNKLSDKESSFAMKGKPVDSAGKDESIINITGNCGNKIVLDNLRKCYKVKGLPDNQRVAVDGLSLTIEESNVVILLGPNGAGKSTTFNMLTGMVNPTSGDANLCGYSLLEDMDTIRTFMGFVPQVNVLYRTLTVQAHLELMCILRGGLFTLAQYQDLLIDLDMMKMMETQAKALSGGQKRKLCLAMALVGQTKILYLDESTSGVDPESRTHFWNILKKYKHGRIVICTTHFLDEANYLADKIAVICDGKLKSFGSPMDLKKEYGDGYKITISSENTKLLNDERKNIENVLTACVPDAILHKNRLGNSKALEYSVPYASVAQCMPFLTYVENAYPNFIIRFDMDDMENVFLKIIDEPVDQSKMNVLAKGNCKNSNMQVLKAMLLKRLVNYKHEWILWTAIFVVAVFGTTVPLILGTIQILDFVSNVNFEFRTLVNFQGFVNVIVQNLLIVIGITFIQVPVVAAIVIEKEIFHNIKEMQLLCNVKLWIYWLGMYLFDQLYFVAFAFFLVLFMLGYQNGPPPCDSSTYTCIDGYPTTYTFVHIPANNYIGYPQLIFSYMALIWVFVFTFPGWIYALSCLFKDHTKAIIYAIISVMVLAVGIPLIVCIMVQINAELGSFTTATLGTAIDLILNIVPIYALMMGLSYPRIQLYNSESDYMNDPCSAIETAMPMFFECRSWYVDLFFRISYMIVAGFACWLFVYGKENDLGFWSSCKRCFGVKNSWESLNSAVLDEDDLIAEKIRMESHQFNKDVDNSNNDNLQLREITKGYKKKDHYSVEKVSFGVKPGEIFGFLGANGAGKSTTFKIITGLEAPSSGGAYIQNINPSKDKNEARKLMGYCSQTDNLFLNFTVEEHLRIFAMIHGYKDVSRVVDVSIDNLQLGKYRKVESDQLSGGNKRKLMTALCLLGSPKVLLLDEPSSGMDPCAQRFLWSTITNVRDRAGTSVVLTSHSFPEIQALCDRVGILVEGKLRCIGPEHYLASKFTHNFTITTFRGSIGRNLEEFHSTRFTTLPTKEKNNVAAFSDMDIGNYVDNNKSSFSLVKNESNDSTILKMLSHTFGSSSVIVNSMEGRDGIESYYIAKTDPNGRSLNFSTVFMFLQTLVNQNLIDMFSIVDGDLDSMFAQWISKVAKERDIIG